MGPLRRLRCWPFGGGVAFGAVGDEGSTVGGFGRTAARRRESYVVMAGPSPRRPVSFEIEDQDHGGGNGIKKNCFSAFQTLLF
jgi:hypothetical protein